MKDTGLRAVEQVQGLGVQEENTKQDTMLRPSHITHHRTVCSIAKEQHKAVLEMQVPGGNSNGSRSCKNQEVDGLKLDKSKIA